MTIVLLARFLLLLYAMGAVGMLIGGLYDGEDSFWVVLQVAALWPALLLIAYIKHRAKK